MSDENLPLLDAPALRELAQRQAGPGCGACAAIRAPGWEALPGTFDASALRQVATLRNPAVDDPTLEEHHPGGTRSWSPEAPIAPAFFPYNRCGVWQCAACGRPFLRYTEYGGYYVEERVRELDAALVVDGPAVS
jgi:hypothetical protein